MNAVTYMKTLFTIVLMCKLFTCEITSLVLTANQRANTIDVNEDTDVNFVCKAEGGIGAEMTLANDATGEVLTRAYLPDNITYVMSSFQCGSSFYVVCRVFDSVDMKSYVRVRVSQCEIPHLHVTVNNSTATSVSICPNSLTVVACSHNGKPGATLSVYTKQLSGQSVLDVLNVTRDINLTSSLPWSFVGVKLSLYRKIQLGCRLQGISWQINSDMTIMECANVSSTKDPHKVAYYRRSDVNVIIGVSIAATSLLIVMTIVLLLYCIRARRQSFAASSEQTCSFGQQLTTAGMTDHLTQHWASTESQSNLIPSRMISSPPHHFDREQLNSDSMNHVTEQGQTLHSHQQRSSRDQTMSEPPKYNEAVETGVPDTAMTSQKDLNLPPPYDDVIYT